MNHMEQVAEMLGVELNQEFKVKGLKSIYKFTDKHLEEVTYSTYIVECVLYRLLTGQWEIEKSILDKKEKEYLENLLRPFKGKVDFIIKYTNVNENEQITILVESNSIYLPEFKKGTMYKGMKAGKEYTLKELGLFENE